MTSWVFVDTNPDLVRFWEEAFEGVADVSFHCADILELAHDTLVSPANSYGYMDGGIDRHYRNYFGIGIEQAVQAAIAETGHSYLPVGKAIMVPTGHESIQKLIVAPTMFLPEPIPAADCGKAMSAAIRCVRSYPDIETVFCPGFGTGIGQVDPRDAAREMADAFRGTMD